MYTEFMHLLKKVLLLFLSLIIYLTLVVRVHAGSISQTAKPITGTFIQANEIPQYDTPEGWRIFIDDMNLAGMDTAIFHTMGGFDRPIVHTDRTCSGNIREWDYFSSGTMQRFLDAAHEKGIQIYLGLSGAEYPCISAWVGSPTDSSTDQGRIIDQSRRLIIQAKNYIESRGWDWNGNFVKGFYILQEKDVMSFSNDQPFTNFYINFSQAIKQTYPNKLILISPYLFETDTYNSIKTGITDAVTRTSIDIYAPQDSIGTAKTITYLTDVAHYQGLKDGINNANTSTGKHVQLWANIETFKHCTDTCVTSEWAPADIKQLSWQIRAVQEKTSKSITWIHQWSFLSLSALSQTLTDRRNALRNVYLTKPQIFTAFQWYTPASLVIKGYNFGDNNDLVAVYIHYLDSGNTVHQFQIITTAIYTDKPYLEIRIPMTSLPGLDFNKLLEIAVENKENQVGYYVNQNPDTQPDPVFSEIQPLISPSLKPTSTPLPKPGDANKDQIVDGRDYVIWLNHYGQNLLGAINGDINNDNTVDGRDYVVWLNNYGK
jgi:hypothetical protein